MPLLAGPGRPSVRTVVARPGADRRARRTLCDALRMFIELLEANRRYATTFSLQGTPPVAAAGFALVTCMDSRIEPLTMLGLQPGDAKILRNAGARVTPDVLRSLVLATHFLDVCAVAVMQHTGCALADRTDEEVRSSLAASGVPDPAGWEFLAMPDPDRALRADVEAVRACPLLPASVAVEGWRYDVETGVVARVVPSAEPRRGTRPGSAGAAGI